MEPTGHPTVFFAGIPAVVINTWAATQFGEVASDKLVNLGCIFQTPADLFRALRRAEGNKKLGHGAVFPFAVALTELLAGGVPLTSMWVGGRSGTAYLSDKNPLYFTDQPVFSGGNWEQVATTTRFGPRLSAEVLTHKLAEFIRALPEGTTTVEITAGETAERRSKIAGMLENAVGWNRPDFLELGLEPPQLDISFQAVDPTREASRIGQCVFGAIRDYCPPAPFAAPIAVVAIGSTTTHAFSWTTLAEIGAFALNGEFSADRYRSVATPKPPSCIPRSAAFTGFDLCSDDSAVCAASHQFASAIRKLVPVPVPEPEPEPEPVPVPVPVPVPDTSQGEL